MTLPSDPTTPGQTGGYIGWKIKAGGPRSPVTKARRARLGKAYIRRFKHVVAEGFRLRALSARGGK